MEIYTSYYGNVKKLRGAGIVPVAISVGIPRYFKGYSIKYLAPTRAMLDLSEKAYTPKYKEILERVDLDRLRADVLEISKKEGGKDIALLCYEKPGDFCHRRLFAEWLKEKTGYEVREFGVSETKEPVAKQGDLF